MWFSSSSVEMCWDCSQNIPFNCNKEANLATMLYNFNLRDKQLQAAEKYLAVCKIGWSKSHVGELSFCDSR